MLQGNAITQKKIAGEAANCVVVNGLLFKIAETKKVVNGCIIYSK